MSETGAALGRGRRQIARHWAELTPAERTAAVERLALPSFRVDQISRHYFERHEADPATWTDLPKAVREPIEEFFPPLLEEVDALVADRGRTIKSLYRLTDASLVEAVWMSYPRGKRLPEAGSGPLRDLVGWGSEAGSTPPGARSTLCVSSQVGCGIGCPFCATGQAGLTRNLTAGEILEQVRLAIGTAEAATGGALNNLVFMGMGEPLANYAALMTAVRAIVAPAPGGFGISARGITISTAGLVPRIFDLAQERLPLTLAVSLHASDDELRDQLVPLNRRWPIGELLDAAKAYFETTGRRVSIEYALMRDINDQEFRAGQLAAALNARGRGWVHVNLIPLNPTPGSPWTASRKVQESEFVARLEAAHIPVTLRDTRGRKIDAACGQLAAAGQARTEVRD